MSRGRTVVRESHHGLGLLAAGGILLLALTGLALQHPGWFGHPGQRAIVLSADPNTGDRLLRATPALLEVSTDGGDTWQDLPLSAAPDHPVRLVFGDVPGEVWLLGGTELLVSRDGGRIWEDVGLPPDLGPQQPATDLTFQGGYPLVAGRSGAWYQTVDGGWENLWTTPASRGDNARAWLYRLHTGHWGGGLVPRLYDLVAVATAILVVTGLIMGARRARRRRR